MAAVVRVLIADDEGLLRAGLRLVLDGAAGIEVVAEAADGDEAVAMARRHDPDVVLLDVRMPRRNGLEAARVLAPTRAAVVMLTAFDTDDYVLDALEAGAVGFLLKDTRPTDLVEAVVRAADGDRVLSPAVLTRLVAFAVERRPRDPRSSRLAALSERERAVATAVARGLTNAEIAAELHLSLATVKTHLVSTYVKLGTTNRVQVALLVTAAERER